DVQVAVGDHRAAPVPAPPPDHVHTGDVERVGGAHDRPDVEVAAPVLDRDVQRVAPGVEVGDDRLDGPVAVAVGDVAVVAVREQLGVEALVVRPGLRVRAHTGPVDAGHRSTSPTASAASVSTATKPTRATTRASSGWRPHHDRLPGQRPSSTGPGRTASGT